MKYHGKKQKLSQDDYKDIVNQKDNGKSWEEIAKDKNVSISYVVSIYKKYGANAENT